MQSMINEPSHNDVLCGRGGRVAQHPGNLYFRELVRTHRAIYLAKNTKKLEKINIAAKIVKTIRNLEPPGRFLTEVRKTYTTEDGMAGSKITWVDIGDDRARKKAGQAMREKVKEEKQQINTDGKANLVDVKSASPVFQPSNKVSDTTIQEPIQDAPNSHSSLNKSLDNIRGSLSNSSREQPSSYIFQHKQIISAPQTSCRYNIRRLSDETLDSLIEEENDINSKKTRQLSLDVTEFESILCEGDVFEALKNERADDIHEEEPPSSNFDAFEIFQNLEFPVHESSRKRKRFVLPPVSSLSRTARQKLFQMLKNEQSSLPSLNYLSSASYFRPQEQNKADNPKKLKYSI